MPFLGYPLFYLYSPSRNYSDAANSECGLLKVGYRILNNFMLKNWNVFLIHHSPKFVEKIDRTNTFTDTFKT